MQPLNAIDAIAPAFTRTHQTLFHPFRVGRSWKLAASQYLGFCGAMFLPTPLFYLLVPTSVISQFPTARAILLAGTLAFTLLSLIIVYLCGRMELVAFEMLVTRAKFVAPMWRRYSARVWPWIGLKILVGTLYTALIVALFYAPIHHMTQNLFGAFTQASVDNLGPKPDPEQVQALIAPIMAQMMGLQFSLYGLILLIKIPSTLLNDFVLPFFVLEDISLFAALRRGFAVFVADPLGVLLYLVLKAVLFVIGTIMNQIVTTIVLIPLGIVFGIVIAIGGLAGAASHHNGAGTGVAFGLGLFLIMILFIVLVAYFSIFTIGYLVALLEAYGIYFLGGRYPLLGSLLEPGPGTPFTPPPVFPSEDELRDDDGGPPMPMDPAVA